MFTTLEVERHLILEVSISVRVERCNCVLNRQGHNHVNEIIPQACIKIQGFLRKLPPDAHTVGERDSVPVTSDQNASACKTLVGTRMTMGSLFCRFPSDHSTARENGCRRQEAVLVCTFPWCVGTRLSRCTRRRRRFRPTTQSCEGCHLAHCPAHAPHIQL